MNGFIEHLEQGVRNFVVAMRDSGLNTECSCHHEGYISIQCLDPTTERDRIFNVLHTMGVKEWTAELTVTHTDGSYISIWVVRADAFKLDRIAVNRPTDDKTPVGVGAPRDSA